MNKQGVFHSVRQDWISMQRNIGQLLSVLLVFWFGLFAPQSMSVPGDIAPLGNPDGELNQADLILMERHILGIDLLLPHEQDEVDIAPLGSPDGVVTLADYILLQRIVLGEAEFPQPAAPVLDAPSVSTTNDNPFTITGGNVVAGALVDIYVNDVLATSLQAVGTTFSAAVPLLDGSNDIYAIAVDDGIASDASNIISVEYQNVLPRDLTDSVISVDTIWTPGPSNDQYNITGEITISSGATLTIMPGVVLNFSEPEGAPPFLLNAGIKVNGELRLLGSEAQPILLTGSQVMFSGLLGPGWGGVTIESSGTLEVAHTTIEHANVALRLLSGANVPTVSKVNFVDNSVALNIRGQYSTTVTQNNFIDNINSITLDDHEEGGDIFYPQPLVNYNNFYNTPDFRFDADSGCTSSPTFPPTQCHIYMYDDGGSAGTLNARYNWWGSSDENEIVIKIDDQMDDTDLGVVDFSRFLDGIDGSPVSTTLFLSGVTVGSYSLEEHTNYEVVGDWTVSAGSTITVPDTVSFMVTDGVTITVDGTLDINGSESNSVFVTSENELAPPIDSYHWNGITVNAGGNVNLSYAEISHARWGVKFLDGSVGQISNSHITQNRHGVAAFSSSSVDVLNSSIYSNYYGIYFIGDVTSATTGNIFDGNDTSIYLDGENHGGSDVWPSISINENSFLSLYRIDAGDTTCTTAGEQCHVDVRISEPDAVIDGRNNWWDTSDFEQITNYIRDYHHLSQLSRLDFSGFKLEENGPSSDIEILAGREVHDRTLQGGISYRLYDCWEIAASSTVTVPEGILIRALEDSCIDVRGSLNVLGSAYSPVVVMPFPIATGTSTFSRSWSGIEVQDGGYLELDSTFIQDAHKAIVFKQGSSGMVSDSTLSSNHTGIEVVGVSPSIQGNVFVYNSTGLRLSNMAAPVVAGNTFVENSTGARVIGENNGGTSPIASFSNNDFYSNDFNMAFSDFVEGTGVSGSIDVSNNWWGVAASEFSHTRISVGDLPESAFIFLPAANEEINSHPWLSSHSINDYVLSPNSDGVKDSTNYLAFLSNNTVSWNADIVDSSFTVVNDYFDVTSSAVDIDWLGDKFDGLTAEDGIYQVRTFANAGGLNRMVGIRDVVIDTQAPLVSAVLPEGGAYLYSKLTDLTGSIIDPTLGEYVVEFREQDSSEPWTNLRSFNPGGSGANILPSIDLSSIGTLELGNSEGDPVSIANGLYDLRIIAVDEGGNQTTYVEAFELDLIHIFNISTSADVRQTTFDLNTQPVSINFELTQSANVTLNLYRLNRTFDESGLSRGELVYTGTNSFSAGSGSFLVEESGLISSLSKGLYEFNLVVDDGAIERAKYDSSRLHSGTFQVSTTSSSFNPTRNEFAEITIDSSVPLALDLYSNPGSVFPFFPGSSDRILDQHYFPVGETTVRWNGRNAAGRAYSENLDNLFLTDFGSPFFPHDSLFYQVDPTVNIKPPEFDQGVLEIKTNPYIVRHSDEQFTGFEFTISDDALVTVTLLPPGVTDVLNSSAVIMSNSAGLQYNGQQLDAISSDDSVVYDVQWKGFDDADTNNILISESGVYSFVIDAESVADGTTARYVGNIRLYK